MTARPYIAQAIASAATSTVASKVGKAVMAVRAIVLFVGLALAACSAPSGDPASQMPITVESAQFPDVEIECRGDGGLSADDCLSWAEQMLPAAPTRPSGGEDIPVAKLVLTYRTATAGAPLTTLPGTADW